MTVLRKEKVILLFASTAIRDRVLFELKECIDFASTGGCFSKMSSISWDLMLAHQSTLLQSTPSPLYRRLMVHLNLMEMVSRLLKPRPTCIDRTSLLRVVALPYTEFHRQLVVSTAQCLAAGPVPRQETVTIPPRRHQCRSPAACRISFLLLKRKSNTVVAGHRQYRVPIRARCIQYASLLNARPWIAVRLDNRALQVVSLPALSLISGADRRPLLQFPHSVFLPVR